MTEKEKMLAGKIYDPSDKELAELRTKAHKLSQQYSSLYEDDERRNAILDELLPDHGEGFFLQGPVYFDYGVFTKFGSGCYANFNLTVLDTCRLATTCFSVPTAPLPHLFTHSDGRSVT